MAQSKIQILDKNKTLKHILVNNSTVKKYLKLKDKVNRRNVYISKDNYKALFKKVTKKSKPKGTRGTTISTAKKYVRFRFSLWRRNITDDYIERLFQILKERYSRVKGLNKSLPAQRIGIAIGTKEKTITEFKSRRTNRTRHTEQVDLISTITYEREAKGTEVMFQELQEKVLDYINKRLDSPSLLDEEKENIAKDFYVFFSQA